MSARGPLIRLKLAIWRSGRPQWAIARDAGVSPTLLSYIVNGRREATETEREQPAKVLGASAGALFARARAR